MFLASSNRASKLTSKDEFKYNIFKKKLTTKRQQQNLTVESYRTKVSKAYDTEKER